MADSCWMPREWDAPDPSIAQSITRTPVISLAGFAWPLSAAAALGSETIASVNATRRELLGLDMASVSSRFPLPPDQLPRVQIDAATALRWKEQAQATIAGILMDKGSWYYRFDQAHPAYKGVYDKNDTQGCARVLPESNRIEFLCRGQMHMSLDDIVYGLRAQTTAEQRSVLAQLYQDVCVDGALLALLESHTEQDPFHGAAIKWSAFLPPLKQFFSVNDYIHYEYCCTATDADGHKVLVQYKTSPEFAPDQLTDHALSIARKKTFIVTTFRQDEREQLTITTLVQNEASGSLPTWKLKVLTPVLYQRMLYHYGLVNVKALAHAGITAATLAPRKQEQATNCRVCRKRFGLRRFKKWCQACGHAMCRSCTMKLSLVNDSGEQGGTRLPLVKARFCVRCLIQARERRIKCDHDRKQQRKERASERVTSLCEFDDASLDSWIVDPDALDDLLDLHAIDLGEDFDEYDDDVSSWGGTEAGTSRLDLLAEPLEDEEELQSVATAEELACIARVMAEHAAQLQAKERA